MSIVELGLAIEVVQVVILAALVYHSFVVSRVDRRKRSFFFAFVVYALASILHIYSRTAHIGFLPMWYCEAFALFSHMFKTMFFVLFAYAILDALISGPYLKRIIKSNTILVFLILFLLSAGIVSIEGSALLFHDTGKELIYELLEMATQLVIINIAYYSWKDTKSGNLLIVGGAFFLFFTADAGHMYRILWGAPEIEYVIRHVLRLSAVAMLAFAMIFHRAKS